VSGYSIFHKTYLFAYFQNIAAVSPGRAAVQIQICLTAAAGVSRTEGDQGVKDMDDVFTPENSI
jgi:hypothetical protein